MADERDKEPTIPRSTDEENQPVDTTSAEPLRKAKIEEPKKEDPDEEEQNPPRTTRDFSQRRSSDRQGAGERSSSRDRRETRGLRRQLQ